MDERISVGTSFRNGWFIAWVVLASLGVFAGFSLIAFQPDAATVVLIVAVSFALIALLQGLAIARGRKWIASTDDGFVYQDRHGEFDFRDEDVVELGTWARTRYSNGVPKSVLREFRLVLSAGDFRGDLKFRYAFPVNKLDPLTEFIDRNLERLAEAAAELIGKGDALIGEGWELDQRELVLTGKKQSDAFPSQDLLAVDVVDSKVSVWIRGEPKPVLSVPASSINALVLLRVLSKRFQLQESKSNDEGPGLGRIIFERDKSLTLGTLLILHFFALGSVLGGLIAFVMAGKERDPTGPLVVGAILMLVGPGIVIATRMNRTNVFRCHSRGVCRITTRTNRELEFKDVQVFSYTAIRQYVNGGYTGTTVTMTFEPGGGVDRPSITYSATMKKVDAELDNLRDHVSGVIAGHMKGRLDQGKSVLWTDGLRFTPDGLEIELASGRLSVGKSRLLAYEKCTFSLNEGYFFLFKKGGQDALYSIPVGVANFFPGFTLLNQLVYPVRPTVDDEEVPTVKPKPASSES